MIEVSEQLRQSIFDALSRLLLVRAQCGLTGRPGILVNALEYAEPIIAVLADPSYSGGLDNEPASEEIALARRGDGLFYECRSRGFTIAWPVPDAHQSAALEMAKIVEAHIAAQKAAQG